MRWIGRWVVGLAVATSMLVLAGRPLVVSAATVTDSDCSSATGFSSLQTAITNAGAGGTVRFTCNGTIPFSSMITISQSVILDATGHTVTLDGQTTTGLFLVNSGVTFGIIDLTLTRGGQPNYGGAIYVIAGGTVNIIGATFSGNSARAGAAIYSQGTVNVTASTFTGNTTGPLANGLGGAIYSSWGTLTITNSTFTNNSAPSGVGGAIFSDHSTLTVNNSTFSGNHADGAGAGGGAIAVAEGGSATLHATILSGNTSFAGSGPACSGSITSADYNLIDNTFGCTITGATTHDLDNVSASLQPLGNYGGPTQTMPLTPGTTGTDYIPLASCGVAIDQRGYARGDGGDGKCDIGAVETGSTTCVPPTFTSSVKGSPPVASITATDNNVGIDNFILTASSNATVSIPSFTPGVSSVAATAQRTDPSKPASVAFRAVNTLGCAAQLDPVMTAVVVSPTQPIRQTITGVAASESEITIINGRPGLTIVVLWVNGRTFVVSGLRAGEERAVDVAPALHAGSNTVQILGMGPMGSSATIVIGEDDAF